MNQEVVKVILDCKKDIWKNQELFELVEEYFENSLQTLDFCEALEKCLKRARDSQLLILVALQQFEEENGVEGNRYVKTLEELKNFRSAGDPFTEDIDAGSNGKVLTYRVERNGGLVNATTGQKSDILIQVPNGNGPRSKAVQAVKKMKIEEIDEDDEMDE